MLDKLKKSIAKLLIVSLLMLYVLPPTPVFAEEVLAPTETQTQIENTSSTQTAVETDSNTGGNTIGDPTPTPQPEITLSSEENQDAQMSSEQGVMEVTPTPSQEDVSLNNSGNIENNIDSVAITGENEIIATDSAVITLEEDSLKSEENNQPDSNSSTIETGNAISEATVVNDINSTSINSAVNYQIINIIYDEEANIDLSNPIEIATSVLSEKPNDQIITVKSTGINNFAYVSNDIVTNANSGENSIDTSEENADIQTGNAYATTLLLNKVNFITVNSQIHVVMINIYGDIKGDIILPDIDYSNEGCSTCGISILADNNAVVENNVDSNAVSGQNSINTSGSTADIQTGDAVSTVNNVNFVNSNYIGVGIQSLYITTFGEWNGDFIGWSNVNPQEGGQSLILNYVAAGDGDGYCDLCTGDIYINNNAVVLNNVLSNANTGGNTIIGKNSNIKTGNAYSNVSILNFINTNVINSFGFFGFINIFGRLNGNIGGKAEFDALVDDTSSTEEQIAQVVNNEVKEPEQRESGGALEIQQSNNVGAYVFPGDTVTFFVNVKNSGTGKVYEAKLDLFLIKDGVEVGGRTFDLENIDSGKSVKVTTGFVLSPTTPGGQYVARAYVRGLVGKDNNLISAFADSSFIVEGEYAFTENTIYNKENKSPSVLGALTNNNGASKGMDTIAFFAALILFELYLLLRILRQKEKIARIFTRGMPIMARLSAIRMFLL